MVWLDISFGISNNCGLWSNGVGKNRETDEEHDEEGFQLASGWDSTEMAREVGKLYGLGFVVSAFEMDQ